MFQGVGVQYNTSSMLSHYRALHENKEETGASASQGKSLQYNRRTITILTCRLLFILTSVLCVFKGRRSGVKKKGID